jgi:hypothetical protein
MILPGLPPRTRKSYSRRRGVAARNRWLRS